MKNFDCHVVIPYFEYEFFLTYEILTEYLFYGISAIAIWLLIKIFIDISEVKEDPRRPSIDIERSSELRGRPEETSNEVITENVSPKEEDSGSTEAIESGKFRIELPRDEVEEGGDEDVSTERLIHETFGAILKPTVCQREPVNDDVINRSYSAEERNLLKNNCGQDGLKDWSCKFRIQDWNVVEDEEENTGFPKDREGKLAVEFDGNLSFFEATARNSRKEQEVDLISESFSEDFLDKERPEILVSEWVKVPEHCKSTYELRVKLLNKNKDTITEYRKDLSFDVSNKAKWEKVSHVFKGYGSGVRFILFNHGAVKWSGVSGCRMSGAVVRVLNPT